MRQSYVVGKVWNEVKEKFQSVVGYEFNNIRGYFQFFEIGTDDHFRKRTAECDYIASISYEIFDQLKG